MVLCVLKRGGVHDGNHRCDSGALPVIQIPREAFSGHMWEADDLVGVSGGKESRGLQEGDCGN